MQLQLATAAAPTWSATAWIPLAVILPSIYNHMMYISSGFPCDLAVITT